MFEKMVSSNPKERNLKDILHQLELPEIVNWPRNFSDLIYTMWKDMKTLTSSVSRRSRANKKIKKSCHRQ